MPYSPEDIVAYAFRIRARGYDRDEVDSFLDALADQIEQERARSEALEERIGALEGRLAEADDSERALKRTLITVQDAADRALTEAHDEVAEVRAAADREVAELRERTDRDLAEQRARAEAEAAEVIATARAEAAAQRERVRELQELDADHRSALRDHLEDQRAALAALPDPFADLGLTADIEDAGGDAAGTPGDTADLPGEPEPERDPWRLSPSAAAPQPEPDPQQPGDATRDQDDEGDRGDADRPDAPMWG